MGNIFDYVYFRIARYFFKRDGYEASTATHVITLIVFMFLLGISLITSDSILKLRNSNVKLPFWIKLIMFAIIFVIQYFVDKRYKGKYEEYAERWGDEKDSVKFFKGILVLIFISTPFVFIYGFKWILEKNTL
ncbi:MAG: hypothetical protein C4K58_04430 [Flavobacteriaceae bacterium]|nr:MAG: hypothetical protein C4K58_04430 [Flavobacteriaceae bacterium]